MVRHFTKSNVWTNAEDVLLQAAITKYGLHAWTKVSSMIPGKVPADCKARWYEYLSPALKKDEWTHEEDSLLLELSRALPNQWQTIAVQLQRTAQKCIERFTYLSNLALGRETQATNRSTFDINAQPEHRAARPDARNMDEAEIEMIQTAQARLANVQGKKGKRRLREKQLQDAKEMSKLARIRQLRAAGVEVKAYSAEDADMINPVTRLPGALVGGGFFDTTEERREQAAAAQAASFVGKKVSEIEGMSKQQRMLLEKKRLAEKEEKMKIDNLPQYIIASAQLNDAIILRERGAMILPGDSRTGPSLPEKDRETQIVEQMRELHAQTSERTIFSKKTTIKDESNTGIKRKFKEEDISTQIKTEPNTNTLQPTLDVSHVAKKQRTDGGELSVAETLVQTINAELKTVAAKKPNLLDPTSDTMSDDLDLESYLTEQLNALPDASTTLVQLPPPKPSKATQHKNVNISASNTVLERIHNAQFVNIHKLDIDQDLKQRIIAFQHQYAQNSLNPSSHASQNPLEPLPIPSVLGSNFNLTFTTPNLVTDQQKSEIENLLFDEFLTVMKERMQGPSLRDSTGITDEVYLQLSRGLVRKELASMQEADYTAQISQDEITDDKGQKLDRNAQLQKAHAASLQQKIHEYTIALQQASNDTNKLYPTVYLDPQTKGFTTLQNGPSDPSHRAAILRQEALRAKHWLHQYLPQNNTTLTSYQKLLKQADREFGGYLSKVATGQKDLVKVYAQYCETLNNYTNFYALLQNEQRSIDHRTNTLQNFYNIVQTKHQQLQQHYVTKMMLRD